MGRALAARSVPEALPRPGGARRRRAAGGSRRDARRPRGVPLPDRPRLQRAGSHRRFAGRRQREPGVPGVVRGVGRARFGHRCALLLRVVARRAHHQRSAQRRLFAHAAPGSCFLRDPEDRRGAVTPVHRHHADPDAGGHEHLPRAAQCAAVRRFAGHDGVHQSIARRRDRRIAAGGRAADHGRRAQGTAAVARQPGSSCRYRRGGRRSAQRDADRAGLCARADGVGALCEGQ